MVVSAAQGQHAYGGIPRVKVTGSCSGVLLKPYDFAPESPAYVLTNGHCARAFGSDEVLLDQPGSGTVTFNYFHDAPERPSFAVRSLRFSTMKGTDLAILELEPPEITAYVFKFGSMADVTCPDASGYRPFVASPFAIRKTGAAVRFCAIGMDLADNPTPPLEILLQ